MDKPEKGIKTGLEKIIEYFNNNLEENHPIAIAKVVEDTGFSWSFIRKTLAKKITMDFILKSQEIHGLPGKTEII